MDPTKSFVSLRTDFGGFSPGRTVGDNHCETKVSKARGTLYDVHGSESETSSVDGYPERVKPHLAIYPFVIIIDYNSR